MYQKILGILHMLKVFIIFSYEFLIKVISYIVLSYQNYVSLFQLKQQAVVRLNIHVENFLFHGKSEKTMKLFSCSTFVVYGIVNR